MGILDGALFGTPKDTTSGSAGKEVVKAREFDITQYGKKMAVLIGVLTPAIVGALKALTGKEVTDAMVIASLAVTAVGILSASFVMAVDMIARAIVTRRTEPDEGAAQAAASSSGAPAPDPPDTPAGPYIRIEGLEGARPVFDVRDEGGSDSSFLVPTGAALSDPAGFDGPIRWVSAKKVRGSVSRA
jgi:hypothetical protein